MKNSVDLEYIGNSYKLGDVFTIGYFGTCGIWPLDFLDVISGSVVNFVYLDGFYKYDKLNDTNASPVGYRIVSDVRFYIDNNFISRTYFYVHYNKVIRADGTEYEFYDLRRHFKYTYLQKFTTLLISGFQMDNKYTIYREEEALQPVFSMLFWGVILIYV
jgi:hypothetical protein